MLCPYLTSKHHLNRYTLSRSPVSGFKHWQVECSPILVQLGVCHDHRLSEDNCIRRTNRPS